MTVGRHAGRRPGSGRVRRVPAPAGARGAVAACGLAVLVALAGCGGAGPVRLTNVPSPAGRTLTACTGLVHDLPRSLGDGLDRRTLDPPESVAAAYGSAPVVLTCGVAGRPASYRPDVMLSVVDDVGWYAENLGKTVRYSTPTRLPQVVLTVPADVPAFDVLVSVAPAVRAHSAPTVS